jgi:hypothetical protein
MSAAGDATTPVIYLGFASLAQRFRKKQEEPVPHEVTVSQETRAALIGALRR